MMKKYLLDTNIIIDFLKGQKETIKTIRKIKNGHLFCSVITVAEYNYGALKSIKTQETLDLFADFCKRANITFLNIDNTTAEKFALLQSELGKKGQLRPIFDLLIAASCIVNGCVLVTRNKKDFIGIKGLKLL